jgi:hypothetical protein
MAVSVTRIMPVLYPLLIASMAMIETSAWTPVRVSLAGSAWQRPQLGPLGVQPAHGASG